MSVALFGGTFDPVHNGHLRAAVELRQLLAVDVVKLIPAHIPQLKDTPGTQASDRLAMLQLAVEAVEGLCVDSIEIDRGGATYTVDTLASIRQGLGKLEPLYFALGADAYSQLHRWHEWQRLFDLANLVVMHRPGYTVQADPIVEEFVKDRRTTVEDCVHVVAGKLIELAVTQLEISASRIRQLIVAGQSVEFLIPTNVIHYIEQHQLYQRA